MEPEYRLAHIVSGSVDLFVRPVVLDQLLLIHRQLMQNHIQQSDPGTAVWMRQILFTDLTPFDHHIMRTEDIVADMESAIILFFGLYQGFHFGTADLFQHHHGYKACQLQWFIMLRIALDVSCDHEAQRMLAEMNTDNGSGIQPFICLIFLRMRIPDHFNIRNDQWFLIDQVLCPCRKLFRVFHFVEKRFLHGPKSDFVPDFRNEYLRLQINRQDPAPVGVIQFTAAFMTPIAISRGSSSL